MILAWTGPGPEPSQLAWTLREQVGAVWLDGGPNGRSMISWGPGQRVEPGPEWLPEARRLLRAAPEGPFAGGLLGYIGYEAGAWTERMPKPLPGRWLPPLWLARYEGGAHYERGQWTLRGSGEFVQRGRALLDQAAGCTPEPGVATGELRTPSVPMDYKRGVQRVLEHIRAGDCYQVNLARRLEVDGVGDGLSAYLRLRARTPGVFGSWMRLEEGELLSNSPELYLSLRGGQVESRPIKGTRPLGDSPEHRDRLAEELLCDAKERAELTMIVDLVRNDLGRVCQAGSVQVGPRHVWALPTLQHAAQSVRGQLNAHSDALDLVAASFPPGSVTGAPKVMAMQVIRALEPAPRGPYTGAIGLLADGGAAHLSVAIRTAVLRGGNARVHVGCGIVADSDPDRELQESEVKAQAMLRALVG